MTTKEHVDLWLHGFALLTSDTGRVPFFARGYKQQITALKRQRNVYSQLDANQQQLSQRFATNPALTNAQFLAMYFPSLQEIVNATDYFVRVDGQEGPGGGTSAVAPLMAALVALLNQGKKSRVGFLNPFLYANASKGIVKDVAVGTNALAGTVHGYNAGAGWDACTGLGTPDGMAILNSL